MKRREEKREEKRREERREEFAGVWEVNYRVSLACTRAHVPFKASNYMYMYLTLLVPRPNISIESPKSERESARE